MEVCLSTLMYIFILVDTNRYSMYIGSHKSTFGHRPVVGTCLLIE